MSDTFDPDSERHAPDPFEVTDEIHHEQYHEVPGDPKGDPEVVTDGYELYTFGEEGIVPEDLYVVERPDDEGVYSRLYAFVGNQGIMRFIGYYRHRYGSDKASPPDRGKHECCFKIEDSHGLSTEHCPERISDHVAKVTDAPVIMPNE